MSGIEEAAAAQVDAAELAWLQQLADAPAAIAAQRATAHRDQLIQAAVRRGAVTPAQGRHWTQVLALDPDAASALAALPSGAALPLEEIGYAGDGEEDHTDHALYRQFFPETRRTP